MTRPARVILSGVALAAGAVLLALLAWAARPGMRSFYTDGRSIREPVATAPVRSILWEPAIPTAGPVNTPEQEYEPRLSADGRMLFFVRGRAGENADLYVCTRGPEGWSEPMPLPFNTPADELGPEPTADGSRLYFYSNRDGGLGGYDLWVAARRGEDWEEPANLGPAVNTEFNEYSPAIPPDGLSLYFASNRPRPGEKPEDAPALWPATIRESLGGHDYDLYLATLDDQGVPDAVRALAALNTPANEGTPAVSPAGDFLYFSSDRAGGLGGLDLWRSRLIGGDPRPPENLGSAINSRFNELDPALSLGGFAVHFSSDRPIEGMAAAGDYNIHESVSREVFRETEGVDWAGLWSAIWPKVMWLLLSLLPLLGLLLLLRNGRGRRLSILAKCLLASLAVHAAIMFALNFWRVAGAVGEYFGHPGRARVHLSDGGGGVDALAGQIRGEIGGGGITLPSGHAVTPAPLLAALEAAAPATVAPSAVRLDGEVEPRAADAAVKESAAARVEAPVHDIGAVELPPIATPVTTAEASPRVETGTERAAEPRLVVKDAVLARAPTPGTVDIQANSSTAGIVVQDARLAESGPMAAAPAPDLTTSEVRLPEGSPVIRGDEPDVSVAQGIGLQANPSPPPVAQVAAGGADAGSPGAGPVRVESGDSLAVIRAEDSPGGTDIAGGAPSRLAPAEPMVAVDSRVALPRDGAAGAPASGDEPRAAIAAAPGSSLSSMSGPPPRIGGLAAAGPAMRASEAPLGGSLAGGEVRDAAAASTSAPAVSGLARAAPPTMEIGSLALPKDAATGVPGAGRAVATDEWTGGGGERGPLHLAGAGGVAPRVAVQGIEVGSGAAAGPGRSAAADLGSLLAGGELGLRDAAPQVGTAAPPGLPDLGRADLPGLRLPTEVAAPADPFAQRAPETRRELVERLGGSKETEEAVARALVWLAAHQAEDGRWASEDFDDACGKCGGKASTNSDIATTGLALLCFMGADHSHVKDGPYREVVSKGLRWLLRMQSQTGDLRGDETMYSHGIAAIALAEAYGLTRDPALEQPVRAATRFIVEARNRTRGGWRYDPGQAGDTSVLGWQVMALASAKRAGIDVPQEAMEAAAEWLDKVSTGHPGLYAYQPRQPPTPTMTAEGLFVQQLLGRDRGEPEMRASVEMVMKNLPRWGRQSTTYYWYYATLAMFQHGGEEWTRWNAAVTRELLRHQRKDGSAAGSWDPIDQWARVGGRVYQTAVCTLSLEVYYRYLPMYAVVHERAGASKVPEAGRAEGPGGDHTDGPR